MERLEDNLNYDRIAKAIAFIQAHHTAQPDLDTIAAHVHLSSYHFQRLFQEWAGVTPKKFLQYISLSHAKSLLNENNLAEATYKTGLSSSSRLHDLFIGIEGMTPAEYKNGGNNLTIRYSHEYSSFGKVLIASTDKGICHVSFADDLEKAILSLKNQFPKADYKQEKNTLHKNVVDFFENNNITPIKLHIKGTAFQLKVWEALLTIPSGKLNTYGHIAKKINSPKASRAVGTAIGSNPIAYLIPCHRVIQASGILGGYMWNPIRKQAIIAWESAYSNNQQDETI